MDAGGSGGSSHHHTWGVRPSDFLTVRDKNDLHNISADSGLSHSPIQRETPQLTIGKPIKHIDNSQPKHEEQESKGSHNKWNIGSLFKRKQKISDIIQSDVSQQQVSGKLGQNVSKKVTNNSRSSLILPGERNVNISDAPPPLPPKNSNIFQPSMQVRGGHVGDHVAGNGSYHSADHGHSQDIFPQLRADLQYPEQVATDPRWTQVRTGGYYDQQILAMSADHMGAGDMGPPLVPGHTPVRRTGSVGSSGSSGNRRSRAARTERYLNRKSRDIGDTGHHGHQGEPRSASVEPHHHGPWSAVEPHHHGPPPPPPPPRDPRLKNQLLLTRGHRGRPASYSFEHLRHLSQPSRHQLPPPHHSGTDLNSHQGITQYYSAGTLPSNSTGALPSNSIVTSTPIRSHKSDFSGHQQAQCLQNQQAQCLQNYIDHEPRSRKPIAYSQTSHNGSNASSEGIGSQTSLDDSQYVISPTPHVTGNRNTVSRAIPRVIGTSSPASISSKDSGCSATSDNVRNEVVKMRSDEAVAGFSTKKRRSKFEEAIRELEGVCDDIAKDEDLLDRAERRDLPTAHQLLIWRDRESDSGSHNTSADSALSDFDAAINWNTSSSFEQLATSGLIRTRTPANRRSGVSDKVGDDMMVRRISAANKVPSTLTTLTSLAELGNQSYLSVSSVLATDEVTEEEDDDSDQPDIRTDDVLNRNIRDANLIKVIEPQPKFGVPLGPITSGAGSDYLHAVPDDGKYRSTFNSMRHPDLVKDDLAFRHLRKDDNLSSDPLTLGIVKDSRELVTNNTFFNTQFKEETPRLRASSPLVHNPSNSNPMIRSLSENIAQIIRKQSCKPGARLDDIITYQDLKDPLVYDTMKYTMDLITKQQEQHKLGSRKTPTGAPQSLHKSQDKLCQEKSGTTVYDLLSRIKSEAEDVTDNVNDDDDDEGVASVSSPELTNSSLDTTVINASSCLPDLVTTPDNESRQAGEIDPDLENHSGAHQLIVQSCLIEQTNLDQLHDKEKSSLFKPGAASFISSFVEESKRLSLKTLSDGGPLDDDDPDVNEEQLNKIQSELQDVVDKIDESIKGCNDIIEPKEESATVAFELAKDSELNPCEKSDSLPEAEDVQQATVTVRHKISELGLNAADMLEQWSLGGGGESGGCKLTGEVVGVPPGVVSHPATIVITMFLACVHSVTSLDLLTAFSLLITIVTFVSLIFH